MPLDPLFDPKSRPASTTSTPVAGPVRRRHSVAYRERLALLRYWQGQAQMELRWFRASCDRARQEAAKLREIARAERARGRRANP